MQTQQEPKSGNKLQKKKIDCIYLRPSKSKQGSHQVLHITTTRVVTQCNMTELLVANFFAPQFERTLDIFVRL